MPSLDQIRTAGESEVEAILARLDERHRRILRDALKRYGSVKNIPESVWDQLRRDTENETIAALYLLMISADGWTSDSILDQGLRTGRLSPRGSAGYSLTAAGRATRLALRRAAAIRDRLERSVADARLGPYGGLGELTEEGIDQALQDALDAGKRKQAAADETTGSMSAGQRGAADRAGRTDGDGNRVTVEMRWQTERDDRVCPRCSPLHETPEEVWSLVFPEGPGEEAHPSCRCWLRPVIVVEGNSEAA